MLDKLEKVQAWATWLSVAISLLAAIKAAWLAEWYAGCGWTCSALWAFNARLSQRSCDRYRRVRDRLVMPRPHARRMADRIRRRVDCDAQADVARGEARLFSHCTHVR